MSVVFRLFGLIRMRKSDVPLVSETGSEGCRAGPLRARCEEAASRTAQFLATYIVDFTKLSEEQKAGRLHPWPQPREAVLGVLGRGHLQG